MAKNPVKKKTKKIKLPTKTVRLWDRPVIEVLELIFSDDLVELQHLIPTGDRRFSAFFVMMKKKKG